MAGTVADAPLHDLRHAHASHAVMNGESLHVAGLLLGHRRASTTNRYVHLDDATLSRAAERLAVAIERAMRPANPGKTPPAADAVRFGTGRPVSHVQDMFCRSIDTYMTILSRKSGLNAAFCEAKVTFSATLLRIIRKPL